MLTRIQREIKDKGCPTCRVGTLLPIDDQETNETVLVCQSCGSTIDSDGGLIEG